MYFYGFSASRRDRPRSRSCCGDQTTAYLRYVDEPILGGALAFHSNLTLDHPGNPPIRSDLDQGDQYRLCARSIPPTRSRSIRPTALPAGRSRQPIRASPTSVDCGAPSSTLRRDVHAVLLERGDVRVGQVANPAGCLQLHSAPAPPRSPAPCDRRREYKYPFISVAVVGHPDDRAVFAQVIFRRSGAQATRCPTRTRKA